MTQSTEVSFDDLVADVQNNPDKVYKHADQLSEEQLLGALKKLNPYSYIKPRDDSPDEIKSIAAISHTNLSEDYLKRFLMVSLIGFINKVSDEYEIDNEDRTYVDSSISSEKSNDKETYAPLSLDRIKGNVRTITRYLKEYEFIHEKLEKLENHKKSLELEDKELSEAEQNTYNSYQKSVLSLTYICTHYFKLFGEDADRRTEELVEKIKEHKDVHESIIELGYRPAPPPGSVVVPETFCKGLIKNFLDTYFEYNPDLHVRKGTTEFESDEQKKFDKIDKTRTSMDLLKTRVDLDDKDKDLTEIFSDRETYNSCMHLLREKPHLLKQISEDPEKFKERLLPITKERGLLNILPPTDTFHRWSYYNEVNMEEIRSFVGAVFDEKPELDEAIQIYEIFTGNDEELEEKKKEWIAKHNEELPSDVNMIPLGNWVLLANYKKNRDNIDFYNRQTEILRRIMDRHEQDKKLGKDLMQKRVKKAKTKNIKESGKDAAIMKKYQAQYQNLTQLGAKRSLTYTEQEELDNVYKNIKDLKEVEDVPDDAVQVNVFSHNAGTGDFTKEAIYTESEPPLTTAQIESHMEKARKS